LIQDLPELGFLPNPVMAATQKIDIFVIKKTLIAIF
jgi:hypothetical protein